MSSDETDPLALISRGGHTLRQRRTPRPCQQPPTEVVVQIDDFGVEVSNLVDVVVLAVQGDIDLVSCPVLQTALDQFAPTTHVILDCARASFIDSAGISLLVEESQRRELSGGSLRLRNSAFPVRQVVELTGLIDLFELDNGDGTPDLGTVTTTRFAPVSCSAQHRETGAAVPVR